MWLPTSWENEEVGFSRTFEWLHQLWQVSSQWQVSYKDKKFRFMCNREIRQSLVRRCNASLKQRIFRRVSLCQNLRVPTPFFFFDLRSPLSWLSLEQAIFRQGEHLFWGREASIEQCILVGCFQWKPSGTNLRSGKAERDVFKKYVIILL